ncbi:MAG TPA: hypothetical protein VFJ64_12880 [Solirubrobacterales bacterium]|nr:hypothetical protein [Solirubrobacterales bacterium]
MRGRTGRRLSGLAVFALLLLAPTSALAGSPTVLQPDGKIVVAGEAWPAFGSVVRLNPDGSVDSSFGDGGTVVERRIPPLRMVAVQPNGRIVAASGTQLARFLADGSPDPSFGDGGIGGEVGPYRYWNQNAEEGPESVLIRPDGGILVAGPRNLSYPTPQGIVRLYDSDGSFAETVGFVPAGGSPPTAQSVLRGIAIQPDGAVVGTGSAFVNGRNGNSLVLGRFVPGSGSAYDPSFGGGAGLVRPNRFVSERGSAIVQDAGKLIVAGEAEDTFMLARFDQDGKVDTTFGGGGFADPRIEGTSGGLGSSGANAVAVQDDGKILAAGVTSKWGDWTPGKFLTGYSCGSSCEEPLVARFTADGQLDTSFGQGGLVRLTTPQGKRLAGSSADSVFALPGSKILVGGVSQVPGEALEAPFLARLNPDGSFDPTFGEGGMVRLRPACSSEKRLAKLRRQGCIAGARVRFRVNGLASGRPSVSLRVRPSLPWARIATVRLRLPGGLRATAALPRRARVLAIGGTRGSSLDGGPNRYLGAQPTESKPGRIAFNDLGEPQALDVRLRPGALRAARTSAHQLVFHVTVRFRHEGVRAGRQTLAFRIGG